MAESNDNIGAPSVQETVSGPTEPMISLFGNGTPNQSVADKSATEHVLVNSEALAEPVEKSSGSTGLVDFVPNGDLVIVLTKFRHPNLKEFVLSLLHKLAPADGPKYTELPSEIHARVQSSILRLTGKGFEVIFRPDGDKEILPDGTRVYRDNEDCAEALLMICCVIFWKSSLRPKQLSLAQLSDVCVIIDKYLLRATLEMATELWVDVLHLSTQSLLTSIQALEHGLCVATVLRSPSLFRTVIDAVLMKTKNWQLRMQGKPCSEKLLASIDSARSMMREDFRAQLEPIIKTYLENTGEPVCDKQKYDCDGMALGTLLMALHESWTFDGSSSLFPSQLRDDKSVSTGLSELKKVQTKVATLCAGRDSRAAKAGGEIHGKLTTAVANIEGTINTAREMVYKAW